MIPRRRLAIGALDFREWFRAVTHPSQETGEDVARFEKAFVDYLGCTFARATSSGRDAIELSLQAVGCRPDDEIIVPAFTLGELMPLLKTRGYRPIPADIEEDTYNLDVEAVRRHITPRTRAILATHLLGAPCDIERICELARQHGIAVVEDCAHALGASVSGRKMGTFGDAAIFSFEVNKAVPTYGGGMVVIRDPDKAASVAEEIDGRPRSEKPAAKKARRTWIEECVIRSPAYAIMARILFSERFSAAFEKRYRGSHDRSRTVKYAYSGFQARLGVARLASLDQRHERLNRLWDEMASRLPQGFTAQKRDRVGRPAFYNMVVRSTISPRVVRRHAMSKGLDLGIGSEVMDDCGRMLGTEDCPVAARVAAQCVLVPLYEGISRRRFERVLAVLGNISRMEGQ